MRLRLMMLKTKMLWKIFKNNFVKTGKSRIFAIAFERNVMAL